MFTTTHYLIDTETGAEVGVIREKPRSTRTGQELVHNGETWTIVRVESAAHSVKVFAQRA
jgi:hypothetical protein